LSRACPHLSALPFIPQTKKEGSKENENRIKKEINPFSFFLKEKPKK
jgi:hypothetical protein